MSDIKTVLTIDEVLDYLGIDYADDKVNRNITRAISTADKMLQGSIGVNYPIEDARSKELALIIVSDLYDIRGMTTRDNVSNNVRRLVEDMSLQLRLELDADPSAPPNNNFIEQLNELYDEIKRLDSSVSELSDAKAEKNHTHIEYLTESDASIIVDNKISTALVDYYDKAGVNEYVAEQTEIIKADIDGLHQQLNEEAHFRGYLSTNAKIQALEATPNDFAYSAESGTKWVYDSENGWQNTGVPVPDQLTPASSAIPLINGTASAGTANEYARGDHRHPTDTTRLSVEEFNEFKSELELGLDRIIAIQNNLMGVSE